MSTQSCSPHTRNEALTRLRRDRGLSQVDLAIRAGLSAQTVSRVETGAVWPNRGTLILLAGALRCGIEELIDVGQGPEEEAASG